MSLNLKQLELFAKYPWTTDAKVFLEKLGLTLEEISKKEEYLDIIETAYSKLKEIIIHRKDILITEDSFTELLSFAIMQVLIIASKNRKLAYIYAIAQQKRAYKYLLNENARFLVELAKKEFSWDIVQINRNIGGIIYEFKLHFSNYLGVASSLRDKHWALINRIVSNGYVFMQKKDVARLLSEEVKKRIYRKITQYTSIHLPPILEKYLKKLNQVVAEHLKNDLELPSDKILLDAFPPCIKNILLKVQNGENVSHLARFTLTAFLIGVGMSVDEILNIFKNTPDFDEEIARYQIEHIAGLRGSGIKYSPPSCKTLKTFDLCLEKPECKNQVHPLSYYFFNLRRQSREHRA